MFKLLPSHQRHTGCGYCNYGGCIEARKVYPRLGHVLWMIQFTIWNAKKAIRARIARLSALDYSKIDDVEVDGIHSWDSPDFCDAYISSATYKGRPMTEKELDKLNSDSDFVYEAVMNKLY